MLMHRTSEGPAELQQGGTFIQETPGHTMLLNNSNGHTDHIEIDCLV